MDATDTTAAGAKVSVELRELTRRFGDLAAVDGATLAIEPATIFGLIGPNGAGKSTLIKMLTTLLPPSSGSASVVGYDIVGEPTEVRRRIGYVPQLLSADGSLTGYQNMLLSAPVAWWSSAAFVREKRVALQVGAHHQRPGAGQSHPRACRRAGRHPHPRVMSERVRARLLVHSIGSVLGRRPSAKASSIRAISPALS
jgi:ABC-type sugar transport system ATPase subunit